MNVKKLTGALLVINILQFIIGLIVWIVAGSFHGLSNIYLYLTIGFMLLDSLITIIGLYFSYRYKNEYMMESIKSLEELNTTLRAQRHDYLNHFQVIYGLMELCEYEEAKKYLEPIFKDIKKVSLALKTAQPAVNALLQAKMAAAKQKGIEFFLEVQSSLKDIPLEPWNLCKVLANLIDNSITALLETERERVIHLEIKEDSTTYTFLIYNNGPRIPENHIEDIFKQGFTTKKEQGHGMGLYIAAKIIKECQGTIKAASSSEKTSFFIEIPKK